MTSPVLSSVASHGRIGPQLNNSTEVRAKGSVWHESHRPMPALFALVPNTAPALAALPPRDAAGEARDWRVKHEQQIVAELSAFVALPNQIGRASCRER